MFGRNKLRQILNRHQQDIQNNARNADFKIFKCKSSNVKVNDIINNEHKKYVNDDDDDADDADDGSAAEIVNDHYIIDKEQKMVSPAPSMQFYSYTKTDFSTVQLTNNKNNNDNKKREKDYKNMDIFHRAVCPRQCFALMPVVGVFNPNPKNLRFQFKSLPVVITLIFLAGSSVLTFSQTKFLVDIGINAKNFVGVVFFLCVQSACILFLSLAPKWPKMMRYWTKIELIFTREPYERPKRNLAKRVRLAAVVIIFLSIVEHGLYLSSAVYTYASKTKICGALHNESTTVSFGDYMNKNYVYVFKLLPYSSFLGVYVLVVNAACTFIWNYMDLFIMMISKGIAYRFEQITMRINNLADKEVPESIFIEIREHFVKLCELLEHVDENLSGIILLSCMNNLYFVCYQLLNIFNKLRWPINTVYFWYSLLYLIGRTAFVFLTAASINDQSRASLNVLRRVSSKTWCIELERLIFQMTTQTIALSGKKFYYLTRRLLFGMAGTIVTYELVLLQFDEPNRSKGLPDLCA